DVASVCESCSASWAVSTSCSGSGRSLSSVSMIALPGEEPIDSGYGVGKQSVHHKKERRETKHGQNHYNSVALYLFARGPSHPAHLQLELHVVILDGLRPMLDAFNRFHACSRLPDGGSGWQGRRDSNPHSRFWRPLVYRSTYAPA